jgi:hypothetical protein
MLECIKLDYKHLPALHKFQVMPGACKSHKCSFQQPAQKKSCIPQSNTNTSISQSKTMQKFHRNSCASLGACFTLPRMCRKFASLMITPSDFPIGRARYSFTEVSWKILITKAEFKTNFNIITLVNQSDNFGKIGD